MTKPHPWTVSLPCLAFGALSAWLAPACSSSGDNPGGSGGQVPGSGGSATSSGGSAVGGTATGGTVTTGGNANGGTVGTGGAGNVGGAPSTGGKVSSGGVMSTGGAPSTGGAVSVGGATGGGSAGKASGGTGTATGGMAGGAGAGNGTGGATTGGATSSGGTASGGSGGATGGTAGKGGTGGGGACQHAQLKGSDICTIGDSWIQIPGNQVTHLQDLMRAAGSIGAGESFDRREVSGSTLDSIIGTYNRNTKCKILIMDGGGIDLFSTPLGPESTAVTNVVTKFKNFLAKVKTDGNVEHIIYSLYPVIPQTANLNANMKPGFSAACAASAVHCVLVDLEPLFMGQHFASDRTHADNAGGTIIGDAWWKAMKENCIGQ